MSKLLELETLLQSAFNGLQWYRENFPEAESQADDELYTLIEQALAGKDTLLCEVLNERRIQDAEWGGPEHDDKHDWYDWRTFLYKQVSNMSMEYSEQQRRKRFVKIAALAIAAIESIDRKTP